MPYGFVRIFFFFFFFFLFFRRQGFRMITFDRQAGPLQNFNRSHIMVIGRSVSFSDPARPPGGGVGRPKHPKIPPPPKNKFLFVHAFQKPRNIFEKKNLKKKLKFFTPPPPANGTKSRNHSCCDSVDGITFCCDSVDGIIFSCDSVDGMLFRQQNDGITTKSDF